MSTTHPKHVEPPLSGMTCASCANRIERKLNGLDGVSAIVNYATEKAMVDYDPELARALEPGRRLVVGELFGDPHWVSPAILRRRAEAAGLTFIRRAGSPLGYFASFDRPANGYQP